MTSRILKKDTAPAEISIRPYETGDYARVLEICIAAFTPIHAYFEEVLGEDIFGRECRDWKGDYARTLSNFSKDDPATEVHVAESGGGIVGFIFTTVNGEKKIGEIGLNAVDPDYQGRGIGQQMYGFALEDMKRRGAKVAYVTTGGDAAHAPAQAAYQAMGFDRVIPALHLYKTL